MTFDTSWLLVIHALEYRRMADEKLRALYFFPDGNTMNQELALKEKLSAMSTEDLVSLWQNDDRMPWAEQLLQSVLIDRGLNLAELGVIVSRRSEIFNSRMPSERETILEYGILGRFTAFAFALMLGTLLGNLFGLRVAALAIVIIAISYFVVFSRRVLMHLKHPTGGLAAAYMIYQCVELAIIGVGCIIVLWFVFSTNV
jgi:hypothetical protein